MPTSCAQETKFAPDPNSTFVGPAGGNIKAECDLNDQGMVNVQVPSTISHVMLITRHMGCMEQTIINMNIINQGTRALFESAYQEHNAFHG